jgi:hypothetical protein
MNSWSSCCVLLLVGLGMSTGQAQTTQPQSQPTSRAATQPYRTVDSPYYRIKHNLPDDRMREVYIRMTRMYEEYQRRTAGFSGQNRGMLNFELFTDSADYHAAGGVPGSLGMCTTGGPQGDRLLAIAGGRNSPRMWHTIQHEGFHQFAYAVIPGDLPVWISEGLAEYFGDAVFTGDGYVTGAISNLRRLDIQSMLKLKLTKSWATMLAMSHDEWNKSLSHINYLQVWSMVQFLAHGENGKYQPLLVQFVNRLGTGTKPDDAWRKVFGRDTTVIEEKWAKYWATLELDSTKDLYEEAAHRALTSILGRMSLLGQKYESAEVFLKACADQKINIPLSAKIWLPMSLLDEHLPVARHAGQWEIIPGTTGKPPQLKRTTSGGQVYLSTFSVNRAGFVTIGYTKSKIPATQPVTKPILPATRPQAQ